MNTSERFFSRFEGAAESAIASITERRNWVLALLATVTIAASLSAGRVGFDNSIEVWFIQDDPDLVTYDEFYRQFQADEFVLIALSSEELFAPETRAVYRGALEALHEVLRVDFALDEVALAERASEFVIAVGTEMTIEGNDSRTPCT